MNTIKLPDGRNLGFAEYGRSNGSPVLFCHATPGSRLTISQKMSREAEALGVRLIAPDRPGYGLSDPKADRSFVEWPEDVSALMEKLCIDRLAILGYSMGSPYALACAHAMPERVSGVALVGGLAPNLFDSAVTAYFSPGSNALFTLGRDNPPQLLETLKILAPDGASLLAAMAAGLPEPDKALLAQAEISAAFLRDCDETLRQGQEAAATDFVLTAHDWGFDLGAIQTPVHIWNGLEDLNAPPAMAKYFEAKLPHNNIHLLSEEGHLCLLPHWKEILGNLA